MIFIIIHVKWAEIDIAVTYRCYMTNNKTVI